MRLLENGIFEIQTALENSGSMASIHSQLAEPTLEELPNVAITSPTGGLCYVYF